MKGKNILRFILVLTALCSLSVFSGAQVYVNVNINQPPPLVISVNPNQSICVGDITSIGGVTMGGTPPYTYGWNPSTGLSDTNVANPLASPLATTTYYLTVTDVNNCKSSDSITITVVDSVVVSIAGDADICYGDSVTLAAVTTFPTGSFLWSTGDTTPAITVAPVSDTTYFVTFFSACDTASGYFTVSVYPLYAVDAGTDTTILLGESVLLAGSGTPGSSYLWNPGSGLSCTGCQQPVASPENTTTYYLTVTGSNGCTNRDSVTVIVDRTFVFFVPDIFSPNNDGENDKVFVMGKGIEQVLFVIYDRWGEKVYETDGCFNKNCGWDGMYKGKPVNPGVYVYYVKGQFVNGEIFQQHGDITLVR